MKRIKPRIVLAIFVLLAIPGCSESSGAPSDVGTDDVGTEETGADAGDADAGPPVVDGDPELGEQAGELVFEDNIPHRTGGAPAILTDIVYGDEYAATVEFDAAQTPARELPEGIGGVNLEVQFNGFNLVDEAGQLRPNVVERLQQLHLDHKTLRWPGGGYDELVYDECLGPLAQREPQSFFGGDPEVCAFGPEEANELAEMLGAELWMQVQPMLVPPASGQDEAVEHGAEPVRQHNSGEPDTIDNRVRNWQVGNEQYHYSPQEYSADDFIGAAQQLIPAMREHDPDIQLWIPVQENYSNNLFSNQPDWTPSLLSSLGEEIHGLTIHNGYSPIAPSAESSQEVADAYRTMFSNSLWARENLETIEELIDEQAPEEAGRIRFAITELNAIFGILPFEHNLMNHAQTLGAAAYVASMLATYVRHPRVDYAHLFTGVQFTAQGLIGVTDGTFSTPPDTYSSAGLLLHLWNQWARGEVLTEVQVDTGVFSSPSRGWMLERDDNPLLDVLVRDDDGELGVLLINRSLEESARVELSIANFAPAQISARALLGRAPDSNPGLTIPDVVEPVEGAVLERFDEGGPGEVWIRSEEVTPIDSVPSIRVPRSSVVFLSLQS